MIVDLHTHSTCSDGTLSPTELVTRAHEQGVTLLALTDHDTTQGVAEAAAQAEKLGLSFLSGVEVSTTWKKQTLHIVGLGVDPLNEVLQAGLESIRQQRITRTQKIALALQKQGMHDVLEWVEQKAGTEAATRTHFARYLVEKGYAGDMNQAFKKWLGRKGRAYVRGEWATLEDAVGWIVAAGGIAVIAHPARYRFTHTKMAELIKDFNDAGGSGIEVATSSHNIEEKGRFAAIARKFGLLASAGSDFHAPGNERIELGKWLRLPADCRPVWDALPLPLVGSRPRAVNG